MVANAHNAPATPLAELVLTRVYNAPRERVFQVWTQAGHFARWFGPPGVEMPHCTIDARVGGEIRFCHRMSDGRELWLRGTFSEVVPPERLVFAGTFVDVDGHPTAPPVVQDWPVGTGLITAVTLETHPQGTRLTVCQSITPAAAAALDAVRRERELAGVGWVQTLDRLGELLATLGEAP